MDIRLVAVDMDGTFLRPGMTYDRERFLGLRQRMRDASIRFVVASGNQYWQLSSFFEPSDDIAYAAENGHFVYDVGGEAPFAAPDARPDAARAMIALLDDRRIPYLASTMDGAVTPSWMHDDDVAWSRQYYHRLDVIDDMDAVADDVLKAALRVEDPLPIAAELDAALGGAFTAVVSGPEDVDLNVPGYNKAVGLRHLAERWGIDLADAVAFGDNHNDLEMLRAVGLPVAMANARPAVLDAAARVAPPNTADGVLDVLDEILPR
ncbi:MAG: Cof-type HAD-IIB family hydrolase [Propioniciclava sp.]|uniref:Cof-type HAD-IIB family hydrolase n=1 Tax=Propioniciclava sp. TaxID=2038686 RepID=UPI0039E3D52F